jgi:23S rRNA-/tRNA-specific pseudouridylate synthase
VMLHAARISFTHPSTGKRMTFTSRPRRRCWPL